MGINDMLNAIRRTKFPDPKTVTEIPGKLRIDSRNRNINIINIRYFDRHFRNCIITKGTIEHRTSIPIVYFECPDKLAGLVFDDSVYTDQDTKENWIDFCEDYPFSLQQSTELTQYLDVEYYNDFASGVVQKKNENDPGNLSYKIPVMINRIPREIIRIDTAQRMRTVDGPYVSRKIEITQYVIRQLSKVMLLERVGKKDNSFILTGILLGGSMGIIIGIFISFALLM